MRVCDKTGMTGLPFGEETRVYDSMLSRFDRILHCDGHTDGRTESLYIDRPTATLSVRLCATARQNAIILHPLNSRCTVNQSH